MLIWKMSKMEAGNNPAMCLFIMIQSVVVLVAILFGVFIFTSRYSKYDAIHKLMGDKGYALDVQHMMQAGEYYLDGEKVENFGDIKRAELRNSHFGIIMQDFALVENF